VEQRDWRQQMSRAYELNRLQVNARKI